MKQEEYEQVLLAITYVETFLSKDLTQRDTLFDSVSKEEITSGMIVLLMTVISYAVFNSQNGLDAQDILEIARKAALQKLGEA